MWFLGKVIGKWWGTGNGPGDQVEPNQGNGHRTRSTRITGPITTGQRTAALDPSVATNTGNESSHRGQANIEHLYPWPIGRVTATI